MNDDLQARIRLALAAEPALGTMASIVLVANAASDAKVVLSFQHFPTREAWLVVPGGTTEEIAEAVDYARPAGVPVHVIDVDDVGEAVERLTTQARADEAEQWASTMEALRKLAEDQTRVLETMHLAVGNAAKVRGWPLWKRLWWVLWPGGK